MRGEISVTLTANAGLLIKYDAAALLVDGIFGAKGHPFGAPDSEMWKRLIDRDPPFGKIDYLVFTHTHPDHFSPSMTMEFLSKRRVKGVFVPDGKELSESGFTSFLRENDIPAWIPDEGTDSVSYRPAPDILMRALRTGHLGREYRDVSHFCLLFEFGGRKLLITADIDYVHESLEMIQKEHLRAVFVNPLFFNDLARGRFFGGGTDAESIVIYHIPPDGDDETGSRKMLSRDLAIWPKDRGEVIVLDRRLKNVVL